MAKFKKIVNNFIGGEISPKLYGRTDSEIYSSSCKEIKNMKVIPQGGASRRVGTEYIINEGSTASAITALSESARIIPFTYSLEEKYLVLFNGETESVNVYNVNTGAWVNVDITASNTTITLPVLSNSSVITNPLSDPDTLAEMQYSQSGDVLVITHKNFMPLLLRRVGPMDFEFSFNYIKDFQATVNPNVYQNTQPYILNTDPVRTVWISAVGIGVRTLNAIGFTFSAAMSKSWWAFQDGGNVGYAYIQTTTDGSAIASVYVTTALPAAYNPAPGLSTFSEGAWSAHRGYPRACTFSESWLVFAGNIDYSDYVWYTQVADIYEWSNDDVINIAAAGIESDPGYTVPASTEVNEIGWISGGNRNLLLGTRGREYQLGNLTGVKADAPDVKPQSSHGSEAIQPANVDGSPIFCQRGFRKLRRMYYDSDIEAYRSADITFSAEHITKKSMDLLDSPEVSKIKQMVYQELDDKVLYLVDNNGYLFSATLDIENQVTAWSRIELGGVLGANPPKVVSITVLPSKEGTTDELYAIVKRTINSATKTYLEKLGSNFHRESMNIDTDVKENIPVFMDCAKIFRTTPAAGDFVLPMHTDSSAVSISTDEVGTETGSIVYADSRALFTGSQRIEFTTMPDNLATLCVSGTFRFKIWPELVTTNIIFAIGESGANPNLIEVSFINSTIRMSVRDSASALTVYDFGTGATAEQSFSPMSNITDDGVFAPYECEIVYDWSAGDTRLFVNGKQWGSTWTHTMTTTATADIIVLGGSNFGISTYDGYLADFSWHTAKLNAVDFESYQYQEALDKDGNANLVIKHLEYLEGELVQVMGDGVYLGDYTVASGQVTLTNTPPAAGYKTIIVGLGYTNEIEIMPIDSGSNIGSSQGAVKRIDQAILRVNRTSQLRVGDNVSSQEDIIFKEYDAPMGSPINLFTGDKVVEIDADYERNATVVLTGDAPLPCNVTCIILRGITYD